MKIRRFTSVMFTTIIIMLVIVSQTCLDVKAVQGSNDSQSAIRAVIRNYRIAMNTRSVEDMIALYADDGRFVDQSFNMEFVGADELRSLYLGIFGRNPQLTFTIFPWNIDVSDDSALATCSWSLVSSYGVYNGIYWMSMSKIGDEWKIARITAFITVIHPYSQPYNSLP